MTVPDQELIAAVLLSSEGFASAHLLARKFVTLFALGKQCCSQQQHYDWGLRALKMALGAAGRLLREAWGRKDQEVGAGVEAGVAVRAVCATKLPTLVFEDNGR